MNNYRQDRFIKNMRYKESCYSESSKNHFSLQMKLKELIERNELIKKWQYYQAKIASELKHKKRYTLQREIEFINNEPAPTFGKRETFKSHVNFFKIFCSIVPNDDPDFREKTKYVKPEPNTVIFSAQSSGIIFARYANLKSPNCGNYKRIIEYFAEW